MIRRLFPILSYKTKLMTAQWIVAERMILPVKIVKVGTEERPASPQDIADVKQQMQMTANDPNLVIVTHHAFELEWVGAGSQVLQLSQEWEFINQEILDGLGVNKALLNAEGPVYASAAIGAEVMIQRLHDWRQELAKWCEQHIFLPIAKMRGFVKENEWGEKEYIYPKIKWGTLNLRDVNQERQNIMQLFDKGLISRKRVLDEFDIDPDVEAEQMKYERIEMMTEQPPGGEMGGPGLEGAMGGGGLGLGGGMDMGGGLGDLGGGGEMGAPEMGGGMDMGAPPGGDMGLAASTSRDAVNIGDYGGKVMKEKSRKKVDSSRPVPEKRIPGQLSGGDGFERDEMGRIWRTSLEISLEKGLQERRRAGQIKYAWVPGLELKHGSKPYVMDIAFPQLKIDIEADGETFHSSPKQVARDEKRDMVLRNLGWTVVRFKEKDINDQLGRVMDRIQQEIARKEEFLRQHKK
jgi:very-short-patch-repair endonuclease